jgi:membrane AbrB-like protein
MIAWENARRTALTLAIGVAGALAAALLGLPAAPLIGACLATSAAAWCGLKLRVDGHLRDAGFLVIGLSLGSGFEAGLLSRAGEWAVSLVFLCVSIVATLFVGRWLMMRFWGRDSLTALVSTAPGLLSVTLAIAAERRVDLPTVVVMQSMRVLVLTAGLPLLLSGLGGAPAAVPDRPSFGVPPLLLLMAIGWGLSLLFQRLRFPAPFFVGGMAASGALHLSGAVEGLPPPAVLFAGFCITGATVGSRFSSIRFSEILRLIWATVATVGAAAAVAGLFALLVARLTGLPPGEVWVAFAPGGVEGMAAIGLYMGFDPAYVALHHLARIGVLMLLLPLLTARKGPKDEATGD